LDIFSVYVVLFAGYANVLASDNPVAMGLQSEIGHEDESSSPATSVNPALMYALMAFIGWVVNVSLLAGVGVLCLRNRRQSHLADASSYYDNSDNGTSSMSSSAMEDDVLTESG